MSLILSGTDGLSDVDGSAATPAIRGTDANTGIFFPAADTIAFAEGGAEVVRLTSTGSLCVGSTFSGDAGTVTVSIGNPGATAGGLQLWAGTTQEHYIQWGDASSGAATYSGAISYTHASDALKFWTASTERARFNSTGAFVLAGGSTTANGIGITFPATQSASSNTNTLDDYEEGTWTPTLSSDGTPPTVSSYATRQGSYTKMGNLVVVTCNLRATISNIGSGTPTVSGLPFSSDGYLDGVALGIRDLLASSNPTYAYVAGAVVAFGTSYVTTANTYLTFTVSYRVA